MPHKHRRKEGRQHELFDLSPEEIAKPLLVNPSARNSAVNYNESLSQGALPGDRKRKRKLHTRDALDDTPRAFKRLMELQQNPRFRSRFEDQNASGREVGTTQGQGHGRRCSSSSRPLRETRTVSQSDVTGRELPARIDTRQKKVRAETAPSGRPTDTVKAPQTRMEKKLQRMQAEWRRVDARRKAHAKEVQEAMEDQDPYADFWKDLSRGERTASTGKSRVREVPRRNRSLAAPARKRATGRLVGLQDVVQEPPKLVRFPRGKLKPNLV